jgi:DNA-binding GntR family transcriptional regulator
MLEGHGIMLVLDLPLAVDLAKAEHLAKPQDAAGRLPALERRPFMRTEARMLVAEVLIHHLDQQGQSRDVAACRGLLQHHSLESPGKERRMTELSPSAPQVDEQTEVLGRLEEDIIFGRLAPGSRLVEDNLMARYGASRHYVRQALVQLERIGIVIREKNVGATVRSYSADEVRQIYEVREMLTRQAILKIPVPAQPELVERLKAIQADYVRHAEAGDLRGIHETNDAFHIALFSACGNPHLVRSLQHYMRLTLPMRAKNLANREGLQLSIRQHDIMIDLLQGTDSWALAQLCVDHIQYSKVDYLERTRRADPAGLGRLKSAPQSPEKWISE